MFPERLELFPGLLLNIFISPCSFLALPDRTYDVCVICDTDTADADWSDPKSKDGGVGCSEAQVNVTLKMARGSLMALSVPFVFLELSNKPTILLNVGRSVLIRVTTIL